MPALEKTTSWYSHKSTHVVKFHQTVQNNSVHLKTDEIHIRSVVWLIVFWESRFPAYDTYNGYIKCYHWGKLG